MKYLFVLQFKEKMYAYDELIELENFLIEELKNVGIVDGHDIGSGEINIFILTNDIDKVFNKLKVHLDCKFKKTTKVAYREIDGDQYYVLYPEGLKEFSIS
jgi:hypothetical protein